MALWLFNGKGGVALWWLHEMKRELVGNVVVALEGRGVA